LAKKPSPPAEPKKGPEPEKAEDKKTASPPVEKRGGKDFTKKPTSPAEPRKAPKPEKAEDKKALSSPMDKKAENDLAKKPSPPVEPKKATEPEKAKDEKTASPPVDKRAEKDLAKKPSPPVEPKIVPEPEKTKDEKTASPPVDKRAEKDLAKKPSHPAEPKKAPELEKAKDEKTAPPPVEKRAEKDLAEKPSPPAEPKKAPEPEKAKDEKTASPPVDKRAEKDLAKKPSPPAEPKKAPEPEKAKDEKTASPPADKRAEKDLAKKPSPPAEPKKVPEPEKAKDEKTASPPVDIKAAKDSISTAEHKALELGKTDDGKTASTLGDEKVEPTKASFPKESPLAEPKKKKKTEPEKRKEQKIPSPPKDGKVAAAKEISVAEPKKKAPETRKDQAKKTPSPPGDKTAGKVPEPEKPIDKEAVFPSVEPKPEKDPVQKLGLPTQDREPEPEKPKYKEVQSPVDKKAGLSKGFIEKPSSLNEQKKVPEKPQVERTATPSGDRKAESDKESAEKQSTLCEQKRVPEKPRGEKTPSPPGEKKHEEDQAQQPSSGAELKTPENEDKKSSDEKAPEKPQESKEQVAKTPDMKSMDAACPVTASVPLSEEALSSLADKISAEKTKPAAKLLEQKSADQPALEKNPDSGKKPDETKLSVSQESKSHKKRDKSKEKNKPEAKTSKSQLPAGSIAAPFSAEDIIVGEEVDEGPVLVVKASFVSEAPKEQRTSYSRQATVEAEDNIPKEEIQNAVRQLADAMGTLTYSSMAGKKKVDGLKKPTEDSGAKLSDSEISGGIFGSVKVRSKHPRKILDIDPLTGQPLRINTGSDDLEETNIPNYSKKSAVKTETAVKPTPTEQVKPLYSKPSRDDPEEDDVPFDKTLEKQETVIDLNAGDSRSKASVADKTESGKVVEASKTRWEDNLRAEAKLWYDKSTCHNAELSWQIWRAKAKGVGKSDRPQSLQEVALASQVEGPPSAAATTSEPQQSTAERLKVGTFRLDHVFSVLVLSDWSVLCAIVLTADFCQLVSI